jgi:hypothetical protein
LFQKKLNEQLRDHCLVMWDLWWTKWRWGRFSPSTSVSPARPQYQETQSHSTKNKKETITGVSPHLRPRFGIVSSKPSPDVRSPVDRFPRASRYCICKSRTRKIAVLMWCGSNFVPGVITHVSEGAEFPCRQLTKEYK